MDAPDPAIASEARLRAIPFRVWELKSQPAITRTPIIGFTEGHGRPGWEESSVHFTYTLWRYPGDHSDPRNEVVLDQRTRRSIEEEPPWGRPQWLIEQAQLHRYPMLWEAARTSWFGSAEHPAACLPAQLLGHTNHVLRNSFREELGLPAGPGGDHSWKVTPSAITPSMIEIDGHERPGVQIDTDPLVYAIGARMDDQLFCTVVLPREALPLLDLALTMVPK